MDIRDVRPEDLRGSKLSFTLAALSNDPLGDLRPELTQEINFEATLKLALAAKAAGVRALCVCLVVQHVRRGTH